ncbi:S1-C subfamily serine protease [Mobilisporobacter senegalensis]|uniref:S1-C subfamily serine protease n=1 Tax=Mobilisporobacter senegalensis TaxID=1329262 RepID=A0A3N1X569_9FIRM|nr:PDZ domain-containing protein [Mobilisporobacter senegalensis]ROR21939.1 S1-C subfamily serine protease [Mobilisporobacter senegalensis]
MSADWKETNNEESEFSFIQEQIVPKKENKTKRIIGIFLITVVLAVIFGLIARYVFCVSESLFNNILGISEKKDTIKFPSIDPGEDSKNQGNVSEPKDNTDKQGEETEDENKTIVIENSVKADVSDYVTMYSKINEVAAGVNKSVVKITSAEKAVDWFNNDYESESITSGIILAKDSTNIYILTSNNKIVSEDNIKVTFQDNISVAGEFQRSDNELNLAVIIVDVSQVPEGTLKKIEVAKLGESYLLNAGDPVLALGNPNGYSDSMELGMITNDSNSIYTVDNKIELFNTNINDNPNGDGVIANLKGEIVGIITQKFKSDFNENINTVLSISRIKPVIERLVNNKAMASVGIIGADMTSEIAKSYGLTTGIYVTEVKAKSPAFNAGIKSGDVILAIEDKKTVSMVALNNILMEYQPQDVVELTFKRTTKEDDNETTVNITLGNKK